MIVKQKKVRVMILVKIMFLLKKKSLFNVVKKSIQSVALGPMFILFLYKFHHSKQVYKEY